MTTSQSREEPVIVVFFGDHRPGTPLESGATVYSELGMSPENVADWELEDYAELYSTDYVIWSNYPDAAASRARKPHEHLFHTSWC